MSGSSALRPLIFALAFLSLIGGLMLGAARAGDPVRPAFNSVFSTEEMPQFDLKAAFTPDVVRRKVRVYLAPFHCPPCELQKPEYAGVADVADVEYVVGGPSWIEGYPTTLLVDVNRVMKPGFHTAAELREKLVSNPLPNAVGLGSLTLGTLPGKAQVADLIAKTASTTGQLSGTMTIQFDGHGQRSLKLAEGIELKIGDPVAIKYTWTKDRLEAVFSPAAAVTAKVKGVQSAVSGVSADLQKIVIDLPGWLTPDLRIDLK